MFNIRPYSRGYDELFDTMVEAVPSGTFYDFSRPIVMWRREPVGFILETDNPGYPVLITRERLGDFDIGVDQANLREEAMVVPEPGQQVTHFYLTLGRGRNRLTAHEIVPNGTGRRKIIEVIATTNTLVYETLGREMHKTLEKAIDQQSALYSKYSTRLMDQLSGVGDILPDLQTLKVLSTRMLIRAFVHFPATEIGIRNSIEAVTLNTPVMIPARRRPDSQIEATQTMRAIENIAGREAHIWFPNLAVIRWLAYVKMADTFRNNYELMSVRDDLVRVKYKGRMLEHRFDYNGFGQNFLTNIALKDCFNNIAVENGIYMTTKFAFQCWTYPLDYSITAENCLGLTRPFLDSGIELDSGVPFDADAIDPWSDGFIGWNYSGRFEQETNIEHPFDSTVSPSIYFNGPGSAYQGPYTQLLNSHSSETEIDYNITASGTMSDYLVGAITKLGCAFDGNSFVAGDPVLVLVKYEDVMGMTNVLGSGIIRVLEPLSGVDEFAPVSNGFVYVYFTPTLATPSTVFELSDGTYTGSSEPFTVLPGPLAGITISNIGNSFIGDNVVINIQAVDQFGNAVTDVGSDDLVHFTVTGTLDLNDPTPKLVRLVNGAATLTVQFSQAGSGTVKAHLGATLVAESNLLQVL